MTDYYHRIWNFRTANPDDVALVTNPATRAAMRRKDWYIFDLKVDDPELEDGKSALATMEIENPGIAGLIAGKKFVVVWEEWGPTDDPAATQVEVVCRGRISGLPSNLLSGTIQIKVDCRPDDWERILLSKWEQDLPDEIPATDVLPYARRVLSIDDWMESTWFAPRIDPSTWEADIVPIANMHDVDPSIAPGHITAANGDRIYDLTSEVLEDEVEMSIASIPVETVAGEVNVAWNQRATGPVDLGGVVQSAFSGNSSSVDINGHYLTYTPEAMQSSLPTKGSEIAPGLKVQIANYHVVAGTDLINVNVSDVDISEWTSQNYNTTQSSNKADLHWMGVKLADGANNGLVCIYDYHQPRSESVNVVVRLAIQDYAFTAAKAAEFMPQPLNDPTVIPNLKPWQNDHNYAHSDIAFHDGRNWFCLWPHVSGDEFDASKFMEIAVPMGIAAEPAPFSTAITYHVGDLMLRNGEVYICAATTVGGFDATKWVLASSIQGLVVVWQVGVTYRSGQLIWYSGTIYYCIEDHQSSFFFDPGKWTAAPADILNVALWPGAPEFFATPRGATSIIWQIVRGYSKGLKRANSLKGSFTMAYRRPIDGALTTSNIRKGTLFRMRASKLPGGYAEIYGIVTSVTKHIGGGDASTKIGFRVCIGSGAVAGVTKQFRIPDGFKFSPAFVPVDTRTLASPAAHLSFALIDGPSFASQRNSAIAIANQGAKDVKAKIQNTLLAFPNKLNLVTRGLPTLDLPELDHGALVTDPMYVPKGIILS